MPLMVKQGRFRIPDLHGAEKVQMADDRKQRSEVSGVSPAAGLTPLMKLHQVKSEPQNRRISNVECRRVGSLSEA